MCSNVSSCVELRIRDLDPVYDASLVSGSTESSSGVGVFGISLGN